jgi:hypothetical protein
MVFITDGFGNNRNVLMRVVSAHHTRPFDECECQKKGINNKPSQEQRQDGQPSRGRCALLAVAAHHGHNALRHIHRANLSSEQNHQLFFVTAVAPAIVNVIVIMVMVVMVVMVVMIIMVMVVMVIMVTMAVVAAVVPVWPTRARVAVVPLVVPLVVGAPHLFHNVKDYVTKRKRRDPGHGGPARLLQRVSRWQFRNHFRVSRSSDGQDCGRQEHDPVSFSHMGVGSHQLRDRSDPTPAVGLGVGVGVGEGTSDQTSIPYYLYPTCPERTHRCPIR